MNLLLMIAFTAVNIILTIAGSSLYFLFSASIPYFISVLGVMYGGQMPEEFYAEAGIPQSEILGGTYFAVMLILALVLLTVYVLCFVFSKKHVGWLIAALALFSIDTIGMFFLYEFEINMVIDIIFHVWVIVYLVLGIVAHKKMQDLADEREATVEDAAQHDECDEQNAEPIAEKTPNSFVIREANKDVKHRVLLETRVFNYEICYRRVKHTNELVINGNVYDEIQGVMEYPHTLKAWIDGHYISVGYTGTHSFISVDGEIVSRKVRLF